MQLHVPTFNIVHVVQYKVIKNEMSSKPRALMTVELYTRYVFDRHRHQNLQLWWQWNFTQDMCLTVIVIKIYSFDDSGTTHKVYVWPSSSSKSTVLMTVDLHTRYTGCFKKKLYRKCVEFCNEIWVLKNNWMVDFHNKVLINNLLIYNNALIVL